MDDANSAQPSAGSLEGRVAVVTGASSGIGLATAAALAALGAQIVCVLRRTSQTRGLDETLAALGTSYAAIHADLDDAEQAATVIPRVLEQLGRIDILVNNAGITDGSSFLEQDLAAFDAVLALDLRAPFQLSQAAGRAMADAGRGGRIVNLSSSVAFRALHANPAYASAKGGLNALTRAAAGALGEYGITVNAVVPGPTATSMSRVHMGDDALEAAVRTGPLRNLLGRVSTPEDVAAAVAFLCTDAARQVTGQMIHVSAGSVL
jgi:NAD(P)-dependent dehydrogenase (short-subunit alcohol dehydrogenase family)